MCYRLLRPSRFADRKKAIYAWKIMELKKMKHRRWLIVAIFMLFVVAVAEARPRSGASFSGRSGFRSNSGFKSNSYSNTNRGFSTNRPGFGGGSSFVFLPSFGWGFGGYGGAGGGMGILGTLLILGVVGFGAVAVVRAIKRNSQRNSDHELWGDDGDHPQLEAVGKSYVYKVQLGVGRSGRAIQSRLLDFATQGDTSSQEGLAELLRQTVLELVREKDSIRYALAEGSGPFSLANGETKLGALAMKERSHFQVERVRGADGAVRKATGPSTVGSDVLEYIVVTILVATRRPISEIRPVSERAELEQILSALGGVPSNTLLGLEVIWLPADAEDTLTETDVMTTYPELRSL
jgi:uncharacterized membrane protein